MIDLNKAGAEKRLWSGLAISTLFPSFARGKGPSGNEVSPRPSPNLKLKERFIGHQSSPRQGHTAPALAERPPHSLPPFHPLPKPAVRFLPPPPSP